MKSREDDGLQDTRFRRFLNYLRSRGRPVEDGCRAAAKQALHMQGEFGPRELARRCEEAEVGESTAWYTLDTLVAAGVAIGRRPLRGRLEFPRASRYHIVGDEVALGGEGTPRTASS